MVTFQKARKPKETVFDINKQESTILNDESIVVLLVTFAQKWFRKVFLKLLLVMMKF